MPEDPTSGPSEFEFMAAAARAIGSALAKGDGLRVPVRLHRAADAANEMSGTVPSLVVAASDLRAAAEATAAGRPSPSLENLAGLLFVPTTRSFLSRVPRSARSDLFFLKEQLGDVQDELSRFVGASWLDAVDLDVVRWVMLITFGDEDLLLDLARMESQAYSLASASLTRAGLGLLAAGRTLARLAPALAESVPVMAGSVSECEPDDLKIPKWDFLTFSPANVPMPDEDFEKAMRTLKAFKLAPERALSPGGKGSLRRITKALVRLRESLMDVDISAYGYDVYVRVGWDVCIDGWFGNYWGGRCTTVLVPPPKRAQAPDRKGKTFGWKPDLIERLADGTRQSQRTLDGITSKAEKKARPQGVAAPGG